MRYSFIFLAFAAGAVAQLVPDNLVVEGVPPIGPELRREVGRYLDFRSAGFQAWHPLRREMLITHGLRTPCRFIS